MSSLKKLRRRAGASRPAAPMDDNTYYLNWVLYAVGGLTRDADALMKSEGDAIRRVAVALREKLGVPSHVVYRGILLEPALIVDGAIAPDPDYHSISWTENIAVACWFADKASVMSQAVAAQRPDVEGYIITVEEVPPEAVLFHYSWDRALNLDKLAFAHPLIDPSQVEWALRSQSEVITENVDAPLEVVPIESAKCPPTPWLDDTLTWEGARHLIR